jgi:hypothetical protein
MISWLISFYFMIDGFYNTFSSKKQIHPPKKKTFSASAKSLPHNMLQKQQRVDYAQFGRHSKEHEVDPDFCGNSEEYKTHHYSQYSLLLLNW